MYLRKEETMKKRTAKDFIALYAPEDEDMTRIIPLPPSSPTWGKYNEGRPGGRMGEVPHHARGDAEGV